MFAFYGFDGEPISRDRWIELWMGDRHVGLTAVDDVEVSTVWLGVDHRFGGGGAPLIFETMVFGGPLDEHRARYPNRHAALAGHDQIVAEVRGAATLDIGKR